MTNAESQIAGFFAKYDRKIADLGKALRKRLRERLPGLIELVYVYENQNALIISYSPTEAGAQGVGGVAVYPKKVSVFLAGGPDLAKSDPQKLLQGSGKSARHIAMTSIADFDRPEIETLIAAAVRITKIQLTPGTPGSTVIKADEQKARARRTAKAAGPKAAPKPKKSAKASKPTSKRRSPKTGR